MNKKKKKTKFQDEVLKEITIKSNDIAICFKNSDAVKLANLELTNSNKEIFKNLRKNIKNRSVELARYNSAKS